MKDLNPIGLAKKASDDIVNNLKNNDSEMFLNALENHYKIESEAQKLHIEFLNEFIENLEKDTEKEKSNKNIPLVDDLK